MLNWQFKKILNVDETGRKQASVPTVNRNRDVFSVQKGAKWQDVTQAVFFFLIVL